MIEVNNLSLSLPGFALRDIRLSVDQQAYTILMGETGSGKTTLLEAICGLRRLEAGTIRIFGRDVTRSKPGERGIGYVPQDGALFPTRTVRDQLAFAMQLRRWPNDQQRRRIDELTELLGIGGLLARKPQGLSGGERQRVALGRALAFRPDVLLMDEPLSALDEPTRGRMIALLRQVHRQESVTVLHVTHRGSEAHALGTRVLRLMEGRVVPADSSGQPQAGDKADRQ